MKDKRVLLVVVLLLITGSVIYRFILLRKVAVNFAFMIEAVEEPAPLHEMTMKIEGYIIYLPLQRMYGRGTVTIGEHTLQIQRLSFTPNIRNGKNSY